MHFIREITLYGERLVRHVEVLCRTMASDGGDRIYSVQLRAEDPEGRQKVPLFNGNASRLNHHLISKMSECIPPIPHLILSLGTQIVALVEVRGIDGKSVHPPGTVGVVIQAPDDYRHSYRIRFADGFDAAFYRQDLAVLSHYKYGSMRRAGVDAQSDVDLYRQVIYRCIVGSRAYGLEDEASDTDRRGIFLPAAEMQWSLYGVPEQLENDATQEVYWEAQKFVVMALKANPNILECLNSPIVETATPLAQELLSMRDGFLSKMVYQTYNGYVMSQFKKLQADLRNKGQVKWKHVMHLLRLLLAGVTILEEGRVPVQVGEHRERLMQIKRGESSLEDCETWRRLLHERFDRAVERTNLPDRPDYAAANAWLLRARRSMV